MTTPVNEASPLPAHGGIFFTIRSAGALHPPLRPVLGPFTVVVQGFEMGAMSFEIAVPAAPPAMAMAVAALDSISRPTAASPLEPGPMSTAEPLGAGQWARSRNMFSTVMPVRP